MTMTGYEYTKPRFKKPDPAPPRVVTCNPDKEKLADAIRDAVPGTIIYVAQPWDTAKLEQLLADMRSPAPATSHREYWRQRLEACKL